MFFEKVKGKNPSIKHLEELAIKHSIKEYKEIINIISNVVSHFKDYAKKVGLSPKYTDNIFSQLVKVSKLQNL